MVTRRCALRCRRPSERRAVRRRRRGRRAPGRSRRSSPRGPRTWRSPYGRRSPSPSGCSCSSSTRTRSSTPAEVSPTHSLTHSHSLIHSLTHSLASQSVSQSLASRSLRSAPEMTALTTFTPHYSSKPTSLCAFQGQTFPSLDPLWSTKLLRAKEDSIHPSISPTDPPENTYITHLTTQGSTKAGKKKRNPRT